MPKNNQIKYPIITVLMSVYNGQKYLQEAIESILSQTFTDFEFLIINDGSIDSSSEILHKYAQEDNRISIVNNERNIGLTKSLNKGLRLAKGQYIARMDADDISLPKRLEKQVEFMEKNPCIGLLGTFARAIDIHGKEFAQLRYPESHNEIVLRLIKDNLFCHGSVVFRRECFNKVGSYRELFLSAQDYDLWLRISEHFKTANLPSFLYQLRRSKESITRRRMDQQILFHLLAVELAKERRLTGTDSLQEFETNDIKSYLQYKYHVAPVVIKAFRSECFMGYFYESMRVKDYVSAITLWFRAFLIRPDHNKISQLINAILE